MNTKDCIKCGSSGQAQYGVNFLRNIKYKERHVSTGRFFGNKSRHEEWLDIKCIVCNYSWTENTLDKRRPD